MTEAGNLFESYNMAVEKGFNRIFENNKDTDILSLDDKEMFKLVAGDISEWENTPSSDIGGITPLQYFNNIKELEVLMDLFITGSVICNYDMPASFIDRLKAHGDRASDFLTGLATDKSLISDSNNYLTAVAAVKVLGQWRESRSIESIINFFVNKMDENDENYDIVAEETAHYLVEIGIPSIEPLLKVLENAQSLNSNFEYLLKALSDIGKDNKSDRIFYCLKNSFRNMENKALGALYLKSYGDSRAIALLRGYVEKNEGKIDSVTFYEIKHAVESLGGSL